MKLKRFGRQFLWISNKDCDGDDLTNYGCSACITEDGETTPSAVCVARIGAHELYLCEKCLKEFSEYINKFEAIKN